jgi:hypothetical protein
VVNAGHKYGFSCNLEHSSSRRRMQYLVAKKIVSAEGINSAGAIAALAEGFLPVFGAILSGPVSWRKACNIWHLARVKMHLA